MRDVSQNSSKKNEENTDLWTSTVIDYYWDLHERWVVCRKIVESSSASF